jgi:S-adenosylmethionine:tRNA ribosyltransferase-isomerase
VNVSDFDFELPPDLIAQEPPAERGHSRLLVLHRDSNRIEHTAFARLVDHLNPGDLLVLNDTRVFPARLLGRRVPSGGAVECLLLRQLPTPNSQLPAPNAPLPAPNSQRPTSNAQLPSSAIGNWELRIGSLEIWEALMHPGQKLRPGSRVVFEGREGAPLFGEVLERHFYGRRTIRLWTEDATGVRATIERLGHMPLPPYIDRADRPADRERYQTVYAREEGSIAAPTAGLHFTPQLLAELSGKGIERASITLHVGYGTFKPVRGDRVEEHVVDPELFTVSPETADTLTRARRDGRRIIAVGTTTTRTLETVAASEAGDIFPAQGETNLFIHPGHEFRLVSGLITNFHLPRSSLLMLVAAFAGRERVLAAYQAAVAERYRFYSYGDAMLIL